MMIDYAKEFPVYGFEGHKGYGAGSHIEAIRKHGPCALHRRSFLRNILPHGKSEGILRR
jgi:ribonuclease HII